MFDVKRNYKVVTNAFAIGDQITLADGFTATCQKITHGGTIALFLLDQYLDEAKTHEDAQAYMNKIFTESSIFYSVKEHVIPFKSGNALRLPYAEELFGPLVWVVPSGKKKWPLMKDRRNRIASRKDEEYEWGWLANQNKVYASRFARANSSGGGAHANGADCTNGVRPVFRLRNADGSL